MFKTSSLCTNTIYMERVKNTTNILSIRLKWILITFLCERVHYLAKLDYFYSETLRLYCSNSKSIKTES